MARLKERIGARPRITIRREQIAEAWRRQKEKRETRRAEVRRRLNERPSLRVKWRQARRTFGLVAITLFVYALWMCCWPVKLIAPQRMRPLRRSIEKLWGRLCLWNFNMKVKTYGRPPNAPYFLVLNHVGFIDTILMSQQTGAVFVAKEEIDSWPIFGWMMRHAHQIFIERDRFRDTKRVLHLMNEALDEQDGIVVFAEGRCSPGTEVLPFRPSLFQMAAERFFPVHYGAISYETPDGDAAPSDAIAWWRWEPLADQLKRMLALSGSTAIVYYSSTPVIGDCRKQLAREAHAGCVELFAPLEQGILPELPLPDNAPKIYRERPKAVTPLE